MANTIDASLYTALLVFTMSFIACLAEEKDIYLVLVEGDPVAFHDSTPSSNDRRGSDLDSDVSKAHAKKLVEFHDQILESTLEKGSYNKLYSFKHIVNGFAVHTTPSQAKKLVNAQQIKLVERDRRAKIMTTYTPQFLGLPQGVWTQEGGEKNAGEGIVIGFVDTGINPLHPSFSCDPENPFTSNISHFSGVCEPGPRFPETSCNGKIISARFFSAGAQAVATLNTSVDFLSPFDAVGHGSHVASTAAGNADVPVVVNGFFYGRASGMAPRARISVYKAVYPTVGTLADVIAAIDQATLDGVDILTLSVGPDEPPRDTITFLGIFDVFILFARRAGVFVVQAAGNQGPAPSTVVAYSPWAVAAASCSTDRSYPGSLLLGDGQIVGGVGLSGPTCGKGLFLSRLVMAKDALKINGTFPRTPQYIEECQSPEAFEPNLVEGSIVICTFSDGFYNQTSTITAIIDTARTLGFVGFILIASQNYGDFVAEPVPYSVSGILVPKVSSSQIILHYYEQQTERDERGFAIKFNAQAGIEEGRVASFEGRAPTVSRFSSRGPDFIDINKNPTDVLKPDVIAPGHQIWAAWSPVSALDPILTGNNFALLSGTSMATPHIAGIAALIKQYSPSWTPSMIASAISTTATEYDNFGELIMAEGFDISGLTTSSHFDLGSGLVSATRAIDPGLVLSSGFEDYISFLCSLPNVDRISIEARTGVRCSQSLGHPANLNLPSVTISALTRSLQLRRRFRNVGNRSETYLSSVLPPNGTTVSLSPPRFTIAPQEFQDLDIQFNVTEALEDFSFGGIVLTGSLNHIVRIPLSVKPVSMI
ncbi:Subtilisin-like protease [Melia azedarach]|uniref:Subtilisin-like protease n=1 Tax=Melia azedarach TaxID=155640 RepID=A0ACC1X5C8_MELAZ|nr:Subtilisin-like protease [Melia azedarach]